MMWVGIARRIKGVITVERHRPVTPCERSFWSRIHHSHEHQNMWSWSVSVGFCFDLQTDVFDLLVCWVGLSTPLRSPPASSVLECLGVPETRRAAVTPKPVDAVDSWAKTLGHFPSETQERAVEIYRNCCLLRGFAFSNTVSRGSVFKVFLKITSCGSLLFSLSRQNGAPWSK